MDSPENSGFNEVSSTLAVGRDMDRLESTPGSRTEETHRTRGSDRFTGAQAFVGLSLGTHAEGTPSEGTGDHKFSHGVNGSH